MNYTEQARLHLLDMIARLRKSLLPAVPNPKGPKAQGLTSPELFPSSFLILKLYGIFFKLFF